MIRSPLKIAAIALALATLATPTLASAADGSVAAVAAKNGLEGKFPTRGFGDSSQVDVWVPFVAWTSGARYASRATMTIVVKPIGQLIGTDKLMVRGASGQVHTLYQDFNKLKGNSWARVQVDLSGNEDVMRALRAGRLDGLIQDDTAVASVTVSWSGGPAQQTAVYIWDVYVWVHDPSTGRNMWQRYQSYFSAADATRAQRELGDRGYQTSQSRRFWRWAAS
ncbi:MAG: hypothetical protein EP329_15095 [Deltaproteobacteria bacterium]|nr:MAG: hypothetical protein EP329_15095 [Deltaproteobacteria bacterium]